MLTKVFNDATIFSIFNTSKNTKTMSYTAQGRIHEIYDEQQVSDKFRKREFVLEVADGAYTQHIKFQLTQDKCNLMDQYKIGDNVGVDFNLQGKPFTKNGTTMYFTSLTAWRVALDVDKPNPANMKDTIPSLSSNEADDSLPF